MTETNLCQRVERSYLRNGPDILEAERILRGYLSLGEEKQAETRNTEEFREAYLTVRIYVIASHLPARNDVDLFNQVEKTFPVDFRINL